MTRELLNLVYCDRSLFERKIECKVLGNCFLLAQEFKLPFEYEFGFENIH